MSLSRNIVEVVCDGPLGGTSCPDSAAWTDYGTAAELRRRMTGAGWETGLRRGCDRCPRCRSDRPYVRAAQAEAGESATQPDPNEET